MTLQVLRPVTVKAKVTENLKAQLTAEIQREIKLIERDTERLDSEAKRAQLTASIPPQQQLQFRQLVEAEKAKMAERKSQLQRDVATIEALPLGSEVLRGTAQTLVSVEVGSEFDLTPAAEVVVEDGKVVSIRKGEM